VNNEDEHDSHEEAWQRRNILVEVQQQCLADMKATKMDYNGSLLERTVRCAQAAIHCLRKTEECKHLTDDAIEERVAEDLAELYGYQDKQIAYEFVLLVTGVLSRERRR
jgi:hypothetical protein